MIESVEMVLRTCSGMPVSSLGLLLLFLNRLSIFGLSLKSNESQSKLEPVFEPFSCSSCSLSIFNLLKCFFLAQRDLGFCQVSDVVVFSSVLLSLLVLQRRIECRSCRKAGVREEDVVVNAATALLERNEMTIMHRIGASVR